MPMQPIARWPGLSPHPTDDKTELKKCKREIAPKEVSIQIPHVGVRCDLGFPTRFIGRSVSTISRSLHNLTTVRPNKKCKASTNAGFNIPATYS